MAQAALTTITRRNLFAGIAAVSTAGIPSMVAASANVDLLRIETEIVFAERRMDAAMRQAARAERTMSGWLSRNPEPQYDRALHGGDGYLLEFSKRRRDWRRRRDKADSRCGHSSAAALADRLADEVQEIADRAARVPARALPDLLCKARLVEHADSIASSIVSDLLVMQGAA